MGQGLLVSGSVTGQIPVDQFMTGNPHPVTGLPQPYIHIWGRKNKLPSVSLVEAITHPLLL